MNVKFVGLILTLSIIGIFCANLFLSTDHSLNASNDSAEVVAKEAGSPDGDAEPTSNAASLSMQERTEIEAVEPLLDGGNDSPVLSSTSNKSQDLERYFVQDGSLDSARLLTELGNDETFSQLVGQLREQTSLVSKEKRMAYELQFYSQPLAKDGTITLDALECGTQLCFSELRAHDQSSIDEFVASLTKSDSFEAGVLVQVRGELDTGTVQPRRLIFSHDLEIDSVRMPREFLKAAN